MKLWTLKISRIAKISKNIRTTKTSKAVDTKKMGNQWVKKEMVITRAGWSSAVS